MGSILWLSRSVVCEMWRQYLIIWIQFGHILKAVQLLFSSRSTSKRCVSALPRVLLSRQQYHSHRTISKFDVDEPRAVPSSLLLRGRPTSFFCSALRPRCLSRVFNAAAFSAVASVPVAAPTVTLTSMQLLLCPVCCLAAGQRHSFSCKFVAAALRTFLVR